MRQQTKMIRKLIAILALHMEFVSSISAIGRRSNLLNQDLINYTMGVRSILPLLGARVQQQLPIESIHLVAIDLAGPMACYYQSQVRKGEASALGGTVLVRQERSTLLRSLVEGHVVKMNGAFVEVEIFNMNAHCCWVMCK